MRSIAFYLPDTGAWGKIAPGAPLGRALGGRETAAVRLAQEFGKLGWDVTVVTNLDGGDATDPGGVHWVDAHRLNDLRVLGERDVVVSLEHPELFARVRARLNVVHYQCSYNPYTAPIKDYARRIDHYFLLSAYQRYTVRSQDPEVDPDKCVLFGNGIDLARYDAGDVAPVPGRLVWSSSPERGLHHLIRWWPTLKRLYPHLSLRVFYNIDALAVYKWEQSLPAEWWRVVDQGRNLDGVEYVGPVDQARLAREQRAAELFVYPCDPLIPTETWCITALEQGAARVPMLLSTADCLFEVYGGRRAAAWFLELPIQDRFWVGAIGEMLDDPEAARRTVPGARAFAERFTWERIAARWAAFLMQRLALGDERVDAITDLCEDASVPVLAPPEPTGEPTAAPADPVAVAG